MRFIILPITFVLLSGCITSVTVKAYTSIRDAEQPSRHCIHYVQGRNPPSAGAAVISGLVLDLGAAYLLALSNPGTALAYLILGSIPLGFEGSNAEGFRAWCGHPSDPARGDPDYYYLVFPFGPPRGCALTPDDKARLTSAIVHEHSTSVEKLGTDNLPGEFIRVDTGSSHEACIYAYHIMGGEKSLRAFFESRWRRNGG